MARRIVMLFAALLLVAIAAGAGLYPVGVNAAAPQPLAFTLTGTGAQTSTEPAYVAGRPLAVTVDAGRQSIDQGSVAATDAGGAVVRDDLVPQPGNRYAATLMLPHAGPWSVALTTTRRGAMVPQAPLALNVTDQDVDRTALLLLVFAGCAVLGGLLVGIAAPRVGARINA